TIEGDTYVYFKDDGGNVYKQRFADDEGVIRISVGDLISIQYEEQDNGIHRIITVKLEKRSEKTNESKESSTEEKNGNGADEEIGNSRQPDKEEENNTSTEETTTEEKEEQEDNSI
ncbi:MAG: hypothetical protein K2H34_04390, partial [Lachnospiraceae bacterium]|nr:hypothetical protein [Lachnospiraceae bacterium]